MFKVVCEFCDSEAVYPAPGAEGVYECMDCGEFFEDPEYDPIPKKIRKPKEEDDGG
jgi:ribosomal protein L37AE/L43A